MSTELKDEIKKNQPPNAFFKEKIKTSKIPGFNTLKSEKSDIDESDEDTETETETETIRKIVIGFKDEESFLFWAEKNLTDPDVIFRKVVYHDDDAFSSLKNGIYRESGPNKIYCVKEAPKTDTSDGSFIFVKDKSQDCFLPVKIRVELVILSQLKYGMKYKISKCIFEEDSKPHYFCSMSCDSERKIVFPKNSFHFRSTVIEYLYRNHLKVLNSIVEIPDNVKKCKRENFFIEKFIMKKVTKKLDFFRNLKPKNVVVNEEIPDDYFQEKEISEEQIESIIQRAEKEHNIDLHFDQTDFL